MAGRGTLPRHPKDAGVPDILTAASGIEGTSPALDTVTYHRVRLLIGLDRADEARGILDQVLSSLRKQQPSSALNAFLGQRMQVARDFNEFLTFAPRTVLEMNSEGSGAFLDAHASAKGPTAQPAPLQFDEDCDHDPEPPDSAPSACRSGPFHQSSAEPAAGRRPRGMGAKRAARRQHERRGTCTASARIHSENCRPQYRIPRCARHSA